MLGLVGRRGKAASKSAGHERDVRKPLPSPRPREPGRRGVGGLKERVVLRLLDPVPLEGVCGKSQLLGRRVLDVRADMTRVGDDNWRSAVRMAAWHVDRFCLSRERAQRGGDRRTMRRDGEDPDDGSEKAAWCRCIGYRGTDKPLGRRNGWAE